MSMFDYDARPVTPGVVLVDTAASRSGYAIRDFLSRNGYPFEWVDAGQPDAVRAVLGVAEVAPSENLLGFPAGISGSELAARAVVQARRFGPRCCWSGGGRRCWPAGWSGAA